MKKNRVVFPLIILLLLASLPLGIYGLINKLNGTSENPNKLHIYDGKIFYYDNNILLGKYICKTNNCSDVTTIMDKDNLFHTLGSDNQISLINKYFAFVKDGSEIYLYSLINGAIVLKVENIKNYSETNNDGILLIQKNNKWGVFSTVGNRTIVEPKYDYIGYTKQDKIEKYVVKENNKYYITDLKDKLSNEYDNEIIYYDNNFIILSNENTSNIVSYQDKLYFSEVKTFDTYKENLICLLSNNNIFMLTPEGNKKTMYYGEEGTSFTIQDNKLVILKNNIFEKEISLEENNE